MKATCSRKSNGWVAVIEFDNGGRQEFSTRHGTMEQATSEAEHALKLRIANPDLCVPDPKPNTLMVLSEM